MDFFFNIINLSRKVHAYFTKTSQKPIAFPLETMSIGPTSFLVDLSKRGTALPSTHHPKRCQRCRIASPFHHCVKEDTVRKSVTREQGQCCGQKRGYVKWEEGAHEVSSVVFRLVASREEGRESEGFSSRFPGTVEEKKKHRGRRRRWEPSRNL